MPNNEKNRKRRPSRWQASINAEKSERFMATQVSRIDWGTSARELLASSFRSVSFGGGGETDRDAGMGGGQQQQVPGTIIRFGSGDEREFVAAAASAAASKRGSLGDSSHSASISDRYGPGSRYDATGMNLVAEEVADSDLSDADLSDMEGPTAVVGMTRRKSAKRAKMRNSSGSMCVKQTLVLVATIGIIIGGSFGIGFIVVQNKNSKNDTTITPQEQQRANAPPEVLMANPSSEVLEAEQQLFEVAERVLSACSERKLVVSTNECQGLCEGKGCCIKDEDSDDYCGNNEDMKCPAYVGCRALLDDVAVNMSPSLADVAEEDVIDIRSGGKYKWG